MAKLPQLSENAAIEIESILLTLETTQGKEAANYFMDCYLEYRVLLAINPKTRPQKEINGVTYYRFYHSAWHYVMYYEILDGVPIIDHIDRL